MAALALPPPSKNILGKPELGANTLEGLFINALILTFAHNLRRDDLPKFEQALISLIEDSPDMVEKLTPALATQPLPSPSMSNSSGHKCAFLDYLWDTRQRRWRHWQSDCSMVPNTSSHGNLLIPTAQMVGSLCVSRACVLNQQPMLVVGKSHTGKTVHMQAVSQLKELAASPSDDGLSSPAPIEQINVCMLQQSTTHYIRSTVTMRLKQLHGELGAGQPSVVFADDLHLPLSEDRLGMMPLELIRLLASQADLRKISWLDTTEKDNSFCVISPEVIPCATMIPRADYQADMHRFSPRLLPLFVSVYLEELSDEMVQLLGCIHSDLHVSD